MQRKICAVRGKHLPYLAQATPNASTGL